MSNRQFQIWVLVMLLIISVLVLNLSIKTTGINEGDSTPISREKIGLVGARA